MMRFLALCHHPACFCSLVLLFHSDSLQCGATERWVPDSAQDPACRRRGVHPLRAASERGWTMNWTGLNCTVSWLAVLLALAVASPPMLAVGMPWLFLGFASRRKPTVVSRPHTAGVQLLAQGTGEPALTKLTEVSLDPGRLASGGTARDPRARVAGIAFSRRGATALVTPRQ